MAAAKQRHRHRGACSRSASTGASGQRDRLIPQVHHAAAALAEAGAQRIAPRGRATAIHQAARLINRPKIPMAAADGVDDFTGHDRHPRPHLARAGAMHIVHAYQHGGAPLQGLQQLMDMQGLTG